MSKISFEILGLHKRHTKRTSFFSLLLFIKCWGPTLWKIFFSTLFWYAAAALTEGWKHSAVGQNTASADLVRQEHCHPTCPANLGLLRYYNINQALCSQDSSRAESCKIIPDCLRRKQMLKTGQNPRSWAPWLLFFMKVNFHCVLDMLNGHRTFYCGFNYNTIHYAILAKHRDCQMIWHILFSYWPSWF